MHGLVPDQGLGVRHWPYADLKILKTRQDVTYASETSIGYIAVVA